MQTRKDETGSSAIDHSLSFSNSMKVNQATIKDLCKFAKEGDVSSIRTNFDKNFNVNQLTDWACMGPVESYLGWYTPLTLAIAYNKYDVVKLLIEEYSANPFQKVGRKNDHDALDCAKRDFWFVRDKTSPLILNYLNEIFTQNIDSFESIQHIKPQIHKANKPQIEMVVEENTILSKLNKLCSAFRKAEHNNSSFTAMECERFLEKLDNWIKNFQGLTQRMTEDNLLLLGRINDESKSLQEDCRTEIARIEMLKITGESKNQLKRTKNRIKQFLQTIITYFEEQLSAKEKLHRDITYALFQECLANLNKKINSTERFVAPTLFVSYAWGIEAHEQLVHRIAGDLQQVGVEVWLDDWHNCNAGQYIDYFTDKIEEADEILLVGSKHLLAKYKESRKEYEANQSKRSKKPAAADQAIQLDLNASSKVHTGYIVNQELEEISVKIRNKPGSVHPILLDGEMNECLPPRYRNLVPIYFTEYSEESCYRECLFRLVKSLLPAYEIEIEEERIHLEEEIIHGEKKINLTEVQAKEHLAAIDKRKVEAKGNQYQEILNQMVTTTTTISRKRINHIPEGTSMLTDNTAQQVVAATVVTLPENQLILSVNKIQSQLMEPDFFSSSVVSETQRELGTQLQLIFDNDNPSQLSELLDSYPQIVRMRDARYGFSLLHLAALANKSSVFHSLYEGGFDRNDHSNVFALTVYHIAAAVGNFQLLKMLERAERTEVLVTHTYLANQANTFNLQCWPIHVAILLGQVSTVSYFLDRFPGEGILLQNSGGLNIFHLAVLSRRIEVMEALLSRSDIDPRQANHIDDEGRTPLSLAAYLNHPEMVDVLCSSSKVGSIYQTTAKRETALHWAVKGCASKSVNCLIHYFDYKEEFINLRDVNRKSPEHLAEELEKAAEAANEPERAARYFRIKHKLINMEVARTEFANYKHHPIENLVFQGGGPKGIAYVGALRELEKALQSRDIPTGGQRRGLKEIKRVAGTSAGAIAALFLALNHTPDEMETILNEMNDLTTFLEGADIRFINDERKGKIAKGMKGLWEAIRAAYRTKAQSVTDYIRPLHLLQQCESLSSGENLRSFIEGKIQEKLRKDGIAEGKGENYIRHLTFGQLRELINEGKPYKHLYVIASRLGNAQAIIEMNSEIEQWGDNRWRDVIISDAVRASISLPGIFEPHRLHIKNGEGERIPASDARHVDGGMLYNYPIKIFDYQKYINPNAEGSREFPEYNQRTIGLALYTPSEPISAKEIEKKISTASQKGPVALAKLLSSFYWEAQNLIGEVVGVDHNITLKTRNIRISNMNVSTYDFDLNEDNKTNLKNSGKYAVKAFFDLEPAKIKIELVSSSTQASAAVPLHSSTLPSEAPIGTAVALGNEWRKRQSAKEKKPIDNDNSDASLDSAASYDSWSISS